MVDAVVDSVVVVGSVIVVVDGSVSIHLLSPDKQDVKVSSRMSQVLKRKHWKASARKVNQRQPIVESQIWRHSSADFEGSALSRSPSHSPVEKQIGSSNVQLCSPKSVDQLLPILANAKQTKLSSAS